MNTKTRSALRASLKQEDAALDERLPEAASPALKTPPDAPAAAPARKPSTRRAPPQDRAPAQTAAPGIARVATAGASAPAAPPAAAASSIPAEPRPRPGTAAQAAKPSKPKAEKRQRESFTLAASDVHRLDALRSDMKAIGRPARKSELVRAGLAALAALGHADTVALLDALPSLRRSAGKGDRKAKGGKKKFPKRKAAARKR
jgi:hypothetical protein